MNQPNMPAPKLPQPQGKLILPAIPGEERRIFTNTRIPVPPGQFIHRNTPPPPQQPLAKLRYFWRKDPAYKVLMIAVGMVLIAGVLCMTLVTNAALQSFNPRNPTPINSSGGVLPTGIVDNHPTFPTPGGGAGATSSSQPPTSTPVLQSTATIPPSPTATGPLSVQITNVPSRVKNNTTVDIGVTTNRAGASVWLVISYNALPYRTNAGPRTTAADGSVALPWQVSVFSLRNRSVTAYVVAIARDQSGRRIQSQPVQVQIDNGG